MRIENTIAIEPNKTSQSTDAHEFLALAFYISPARAVPTRDEDG